MIGDACPRCGHSWLKHNHTGCLEYTRDPRDPDASQELCKCRLTPEDNTSELFRESFVSTPKETILICVACTALHRLDIDDITQWYCIKCGHGPQPLTAQLGVKEVYYLMYRALRQLEGGHNNPTANMSSLWKYASAILDVADQVKWP